MGMNRTSSQEWKSSHAVILRGLQPNKKLIPLDSKAAKLTNTAKEHQDAVGETLGKIKSNFQPISNISTPENKNRKEDINKQTIEAQSLEQKLTTFKKDVDEFHQAVKHLPEEIKKNPQNEGRLLQDLLTRGDNLNTQYTSLMHNEGKLKHQLDGTLKEVQTAVLAYSTKQAASTPGPEFG